MTESTAKPKNRPSPRPRQARSPQDAAPRQPLTNDAWRQFGDALKGALMALEEDEFLVLCVKGTSRYIQFMDQGSYGMRVESVSDYYLPEDDHLSEEDYRCLMQLGWGAPNELPDAVEHGFDGSPNYHLDLAPPVSLADLSVLAILTLIHVHGAGHPGRLEYDANSVAGDSIRFPHLPIRRRRAVARP